MPSATQSPNHLLNRRSQDADAARSRPNYWHRRLSPGPLLLGHCKRNLHSACCLRLPPLPRFPSLAAFERRPGGLGACRELTERGRHPKPVTLTRHIERRPGGLGACRELTERGRHPKPVTLPVTL